MHLKYFWLIFLLVVYFVTNFVDRCNTMWLWVNTVVRRIGSWVDCLFSLFRRNRL